MTVAAAATLLDEALSRYDVHEVHSLEMRAPPETVWDALRAVKPLEVRLLAPLMALRALPALVARRGRLEYRSSATLIELFLSSGFLELGERPGSEYVAGAVGRFWRLAGNQPLPLASAAEFVAFDEPGYARAALNFTLEPAGSGTLVRTETRVAGTDPDATRLFKRYWRVIQPGSALIRISWLNAIRRRSEQVRA